MHMGIVGFAMGAILAFSTAASAAGRVTPEQVSARRAEQRKDATAYKVGNFLAPVTNVGTQSLSYARAANFALWPPTGSS